MKFAKDEAKIILANKSIKFMTAGALESFPAYLKGFVKGFFVDGVLGIFFLISSLIEIVSTKLPVLTSFLSDLGTAIPGHIGRTLHQIRDVANYFKANADSVVNEIVTLAADLQRINQIIANLSGAAAGSLKKAIASLKKYAKSQGKESANKLIQWAADPRAYDILFERGGNLAGQLTWEIVFAVVTYGGGAGVTAAKVGIRSAIRFFKSIGGTIASGFLKLMNQAKKLLSGIAGAIGGIGRILKGKLAVVGTKLREFFSSVGDLFGYICKYCCERSPVNCTFPGKSVPGGKQARKQLRHFREVDLNDIPEVKKRKYAKDWRTHQKRHLKTEEDYIKFRWARENNLLPKKLSKVTPRPTAQITKAAAKAARKVLGKRISDIDLLKDLWIQAGKTARKRPNLTSYQTARSAYDNHRDRFWRAVHENKAAKKLFEDAGFEFPKSGSPVYRDPGLPGRYGQISLDHDTPLRTKKDPSKALDPSNLKIVIRGDNEILDTLKQAIQKGEMPKWPKRKAIPQKERQKIQPFEEISWPE